MKSLKVKVFEGLVKMRLAGPGRCWPLKLEFAVPCSALNGLNCSIFVVSSDAEIC